MSAMSLVGNVGGQLGMFIGFSFLGLFDWIVSVAIKVWECLNEKIGLKRTREIKKERDLKIGTST